MKGILFNLKQCKSEVVWAWIGRIIIRDQDLRRIRYGEGTLCRRQNLIICVGQQVQNEIWWF